MTDMIEIVNDVRAQSKSKDHLHQSAALVAYGLAKAFPNESGFSIFVISRSIFRSYGGFLVVIQENLNRSILDSTTLDGLRTCMIVKKRPCSGY